MKLTLQSTTDTGTVEVNGAQVPARIWLGKTESGIPVVAFITRLAVPDGYDPTEFERELSEAPTFVAEAGASVHLARFSNGLRVYVRQDAYGNDVGRNGTVARLRRADDAAWVRLDERVDHCPFPASDDRGTDILAFPQDAEPERP